MLTIIFKDRSLIHVISNAWIGVGQCASSCFANLMPTMHCTPAGRFGIVPLQPMAQSNYSWSLWHQTYWGHDLDLSKSRDVIGHVTNRSTICHFLLLSHWNQTSISSRFRDIWPPMPMHTHRQNTHTDTCCKWFYSLSHAVYCVRQTKIGTCIHVT